jgi:hypothetical protein
VINQLDYSILRTVQRIIILESKILALKNVLKTVQRTSIKGQAADSKMDDNSLDRLPVNQLPHRYRLARSAVYTRMEALGIETEKVGNKAYVNAEQLRLLDNLHEFLQAGGTTAEFIESRGLRRRREPSSNGLSTGSSAGLSGGQLDISQFFNALSDFAAKLQPPRAEPDRLAYFEKLERAAQTGWLLRSSEIAELLNLSVAEMQFYGDRFSEAGFIFTKAGYRSGGEIAWRVSKPLK